MQTFAQYVLSIEKKLTPTERIGFYLSDKLEYLSKLLERRGNKRTSKFISNLVSYIYPLVESPAYYSWSWLDDETRKFEGSSSHRRERKYNITHITFDGKIGPEGMRQLLTKIHKTAEQEGLKYWRVRVFGQTQEYLDARRSSSLREAVEKLMVSEAIRHKLGIGMHELDYGIPIQKI